MLKPSNTRENPNVYGVGRVIQKTNSYRQYRSDEPVLVPRTKQPVSLPKLNLPDEKCCECFPDKLEIDKITEDAIAFGIGYSIDSKHVPIECMEQRN